MMRKKFSVVLVALGACLVLAGSASANVTISLVWGDGGSTLTISPTDSTNAGGAADCGVLGATGAQQRCMWVVMTNALALSALGVSVGFDTSAVLQGVDAKTFVAPLGSVGPVIADPTINNVGGTIVSFLGAAPSGSVGPGTYTIGTILWDTSGVTANSVLTTFLQTGLDGFTFGNGTPVPTSTLQLNTAALNVVPEPGTASLLGLGLVGLVLAGRRRSR